MLANRWKESLLKLGQFFNRPRSQSTVKKTLILLFGFTVITISYVLSFPYLGEEFSYKIGDRPPEDIRVLHDIRYVLTEKTKKLKEEAYLKRRFVFDRNYARFNSLIEEFQADFQLLMTENNPGYAQAVKLLPFLSRYSADDVGALLARRDRMNAVSWGSKYATEIYSRFGILDEPLPALPGFYSAGASIRTVNSSSEQDELLFDSDQIFHFREIRGKWQERLKAVGDDKFRKSISEGSRRIIIDRVLTLFMKYPYLTYSPTETEFRKKEAAEKVEPATALLKRGTILVRENELIDRDKFEKLQILQEDRNRVSFRFISGSLLMQLLLALGIAVFIFRYSQFDLSDLSTHVILHSLLMTIILVSFLISHWNYQQERGYYFILFIPAGYFANMAAILFGARVTLILGVYLSIFLFMVSGREPATMVISFLTVISGIYAAEKMTRRTQFLQGAFFIGFFMAAGVAAFDLVDQQWGARTGTQVLLAFLNGFVCFVLTIGLLPIYETIFNLPTKFRLMELSDSGNFLLQEVMNKAPSTYTHSLMMANLSERAVEKIGGDTLLTRVGCLYHDIGKTVNPSFYAENKHLFPNNESFRKLGPIKSAQVILAHVIDGIRLGRENKLPEKIISFIPEHHGTTTMQYFYHQALLANSRKKNARILPRELFQYPGPRPRSKETAVVMIADSVEAASRSLKDPDAGTLQELIDQIVENKISENQFDECPLTLSDLKKVKEAFLEVLISSFHARPSYPKMKQTDQLEKKQKTGKKK